MTRLLAILGTLHLAACTCSQPVVIVGQVIDLWGDPVEGATITVEEVDGTLTTDGEGTFTLPMLGDVMITIEKEGFVTRTDPIEPLDTTKSWREPFEIVPIPPQEGFHAIGPSGYDHLEGLAVRTVSGGTRTWRGVAAPSEVEVEGDPLRVIFRTSLTEAQVEAAGIALHRLERVDKAEVPAIDGSTEVTVDLWVSAVTVPLQFLKLDDRTWAMKSEELARGTYALVTRNLLDPAAEGFDELAPELRQVHAFTVP
ncbi:MAG: carboxypeptidase regulatory-like domain-containing protein [Alphaproteobacteria bacterium]|nr:carboxypeptidase regulatory-like domain-containing protein [Alphaproteobacteria bacterium]